MTDPLSTSHIRQRHILAGDASPVVLDLVRDVLEEEGYRVTTAAAALDLDEIKRIGPDLVILDHMMADGAGSGWELLREIKGDPTTAGLPVVVCTGAVQRVRAGEVILRDMGVPVVLKPFDIDELVRVVNDACTADRTEPSGHGNGNPMPC